MNVQDITLEGIEPIEEAFVRLRAAPMDKTGGEKILVYEHAELSVRDVDLDLVSPTSLYALEENLAFQRELREHLLATEGIDTLYLPGVLRLRGPDGVIGMAPPVVEIYQDTVSVSPQEGDQVHDKPIVMDFAILLDGIHRGILAREVGVTLRCVVIQHALLGLLPYAHPNSWDEVRVCKTVPAVKKRYRRQDNYSFMRPVKYLGQVSGNAPVTQYGRN